MPDIMTREYDRSPIRTVWDEEKEAWFFSVLDVVAILTESVDPKQYIKKLRSRDPELHRNWGTICTPVAMIAADGKRRKVQAADIQGILRIIQSIPSPKAEPLKLWLAQVGRERIEETIDPEQSINRALDSYLRKGYSREWINQRLQAIQVRKELTDEWDDRGISKGYEYAILTDEITRAWSGMSTREYKRYKGLSNQNLRDNMTTTEVILNMLAETSTKDISKATQPVGLSENMAVARRGGHVADVARQALESETGQSVISRENAQTLDRVVTELIDGIANETSD